MTSSTTATTGLRTI